MTSILYSLLKNPALVRLAKGALAVAVSAVIGFAVKELADPASGVSEAVAGVLIPLLLAIEKALQPVRPTA